MLEYFSKDRKHVQNMLKKEYLGDISVENLDFWYNFTNFQIFNVQNQRFNALLYELHLMLHN
jgi:hypothetical protein